MWAVLTNCSLATGAAAADHVRVILDTSGSMVHNDQPRLAILSTILLYDLAKPNLTLDNTFKVIPFDPHMPEWRSGDPPQASGGWITPSWDSQHSRDMRDPFVAKLKALPYKSPHTYYFPYLLAAISDLEQTPGQRSDRRFIVLVTDGEPEDPDTGRIQRELVPRLRANNIRLYVLAFGKRATSHRPEIEGALGGFGAGEFFPDQDGSRLLEHMIDIFSHSFGYTAEQRQAVSGAADLDLEGHQTPDRVAVVLYWTNHKPPELQLHPPPEGDVNNPEGVRSANEARGSYAVRWVLSPHSGSYRLGTDAENATVIVLRPARLTIEIHPHSTRGQVPSTVVAGARFHVRVLVRSLEHAGDPGAVEVTYQVHGPLVEGGYRWDGEREAPAGPGIPTAEGRYFDISPVFDKDTTSSEEHYDGYVTLEVRRGGALVGSLMGDRAYHLYVYSHLTLRPEPAVADASVNGQVRGLQRREFGCATFKFVQAAGSLPQSVYSLRAVIEPGLPPDGRLFGAQYKLDGEAVQYESASGQHLGEWYNGHQLRKDQLLGPHEICIQLGKPKEVDVRPLVKLNVKFTLLKAPYDGDYENYSAVPPFMLAALIAPPTWTEKYAAWLALSLGLALMLTQLWYFRYRPELPPDLRYSTGKGELAGPSYLLSEGSVTRRWLGLLVEKPAFADNGSYTLGWVRPITDELYQFRPAKGVTVEEPDHDEEYVMLRVNITYRVNTDRGEYRVRLEYP